MTFELHPQFKKAYKKRIAHDKQLVVKVASRIAAFQQNKTDPILHDHALSGQKSSLRAFWITGDIRIVYFPVSADHAIFLDIGSHNQVY